MMESYFVPLELKFSGSNAADIGTFSGYGSVYSVIDDGGDLIAPGAFADSLARLKAQGRGVPMYMQHGAALGADPRPVGVWTKIEEDANGLRVEGKLVGLDTETGRYNYALVKEGAMSGLSIGYSGVKADYGKKPGDPRRTIKAATLREISIVDQPMNAHARLSGLKSIEDLLTMADAEDYLKSVGMSGRQATAFVSRVKRIGPGDPAGASQQPGPSDSDEAIQQLMQSLLKRGKAFA